MRISVTGPPYPGPPPRAPHLPLDNTKVHPSDLNIVYKKPFAPNENTNNGVQDSQVPFSQDYSTERADINVNTNTEVDTQKPTTIVSQQPPTIIVVQQPAPQPYMPNPYYGNGYQPGYPNPQNTQQYPHPSVPYQNHPPTLTTTTTTTTTTTQTTTTTIKTTSTTNKSTKPKRKRKKKRYQLIGYNQLGPHLLIDGILPPDDNSNFRKTQG